MESTARLYHCARCRCQVVVCSHCDRGQRYCSQACSQAARQQSLRAAAQRYQGSRRGRHHHAERQRRYRQRQSEKEKVTHQGSPASSAHDSLAQPPQRSLSLSPFEALAPPRLLWCQFCARLCSGLVRLGFVRRRRGRPIIDVDL